MKRFITPTLALLLLCGTASAKPSPLYDNRGTVNTPIPIDAITFYNSGVFTNIETTNPFDFSNTRYFTNFGDMSAAPGFRFDTITPNTRRSAVVFYNRGNIWGVDRSSRYYGVPGSTLLDWGTPESVATIASHVEIYATNIINPGNIAVGDVGILKLEGKKIDLTRGSLAAGHINNDANTNVFFFNGASWVSDNPGRGINLPSQYINPLGVEDLYWGEGYFLAWDYNYSSNLVDLFRVSSNGTYQPLPPAERVSQLGRYNVRAQLPLTGGDPAFDCRAFTTATNFWLAKEGWFGEFFYDVSVVFIRTNNLDSNININVHYGRTDDYDRDGFRDYWLWYTNSAIANIIQFSVNTPDVIDTQNTQPTSNAFYFIDWLAGSFYTNGLQTNMVAPKTRGDLDWNMRPVGFEITTTVPREWAMTTNDFSIPFDPTIFDNNFFLGLENWPGWGWSSTTWSGPTRSYGAVIGRNPETLNGLTPYLFTNDVLNSPYFALPDPTNQPARVEVRGDKVDLTQSRIRAEGMLHLTAKNIVGQPAAIDAGIINGVLGCTNGSLVVSNVLPVDFKRVKGSIYAWSADWTRRMDVRYHGVDGGMTNNVYFRYHVLVIDHDLKATFQPTTRDFTMRGTNVVLQDNLRAVGRFEFDTPNLTVNSKVTMAENLRNFNKYNIPKLKNFLIQPSGSLLVQNEAFLGWDTDKGLSTITNRGAITAVAPMLKARHVENSGTILATNGGSITIEATNLVLTANCPGSDIPGPNQLIADRGVTLSADFLSASYSTILTGQRLGKLNLDIRKRVTDYIGPVDPNNPTHNYWEVTDGISMLRKPDTGDLLGTTIRNVATNYYRSVTTWAGEDRGPTVDGFIDNMAIGKLILDRQTLESEIQFSAASFEGRNAIYVEYLQLDNFCDSDYRNKLFIDRNFTIYFANSSIDPVKLETVFPGRMVWVRDYYNGMNGSVEVQLADGGIARMARALAESPDIDSDGDGIPNAVDEYKLDGVISTGGTPFVQTFIYRAWPDITSLNLGVTGNGTITPSLSNARLALGRTYQLTATPGPGYVFAQWCGAVSSKSRTISFTFRTNMLLQAIFIPNPYADRKGSYNGLFFNENAVEMRSSGSFTYALNDKGAYSGKILIGAQAFPFSAKFSMDNWATNYTSTCHFAGPGGTPLTMRLVMDANPDQLDRVWGSVNSSTWTATLVGDRSVFNALTNPASQAGKYTMVFPGASDPACGPAGDGYGLVNISTDGLLSVRGKLADGQSFSQSVPISKWGDWPFYVPLYGGRGALLSWVHIDNDFSGLSGRFSWIKPRTGQGYYPRGFTNEILSTNMIVGSAYSAMTDGFGLPFSSGSLFLSYGNLPATVTNTVTANTRDYSYVAPGTFLMADRLVGANGFFTGRFIYPVNGQAKPMEGVILQKQGTAQGFFLGNTESGAVLLKSNE